MGFIDPLFTRPLNTLKIKYAVAWILHHYQYQPFMQNDNGHIFVWRVKKIRVPFERLGALFSMYYPKTVLSKAMKFCVRLLGSFSCFT